MRLIRNFIYNFSDIFVVLIIIAVAAILIWNRIEVINNYPAEYAAQLASEASASTEEEAAAAPETSTETATTDPNVQYKEVIIPSGSSTDVVAGVLKQAGLISDIDDFTYQVKQMGLEGQIQAGTHDVPIGSSMADMVTILCQTPKNLSN